MTWLLGSLAAGLMAVCGTLTALAIVLARHADSTTRALDTSYDKALALVDELVKLKGTIAAKDKEITTRDRLLQERDAIIDQLRAQAVVDARSLEVSETQRQSLLQSLAQAGDPHGVAAAIRRELGLLQEAHGEVSVPAGPAAAPVAGGGEGAVRGAQAGQPAKP